MVMRIGGLATGMDIDNIVSQLMQAHKAPVDKLKQKSQTYLWQRDAYKEINTKVTDFRNSKIFDLRLESAWKSKKPVVSGNATAISVSSGASISTGSITIETSELAKSASNHSASAIGTVQFDPSKTLKSQSDAGYLTGGSLTKTQEIRINGKLVGINPSQDSLNTVISKINKETNVTAFYDSATRKISFTSKETGSVNGSIDGLKITFADMSGNFLSQFAKVAEGGPNEVAAKDAQLKINGLETTRKSNSFSVNGIDIVLKEKNVGSPSIITMEEDNAPVVEKIKNFIKDYNDTLNSLQEKLGETKYRDYLPLTEEQKKEMSEKDIEKWEERAKSGLLRNDPILSEAATIMRTAISSQVDTGSDKYKTLSSIGIQTGLYSEKGKLYLDEAKLTEALEKEPEAVIAMFTSVGNSEGKNKGVAETLYEGLNKTLGFIREKAGQFNTFSDESFISKEIRRLDNEIDRGNNRLIDLENNYYRRFTAMEQAINRFNSQSSYLANAFGGGGGQQQ